MEQHKGISSAILLIVAIGCAVLSIVFIGVLGGNAYQIQETKINAIGSNSVVNQTFLVYNNSLINLNIYNIDESTLKIQKPGLIVQITNFSYDLTEGYFTLKYNNSGTNMFNNTYMNFTYTWGASDIRFSIQQGISSSFASMKATGDYMPLFVLALVVAIVLSTILGAGLLKGGSGNNGMAL